VIEMSEPMPCPSGWVPINTTEDGRQVCATIPPCDTGNQPCNPYITSDDPELFVVTVAADGSVTPTDPVDMILPETGLGSTLIIIAALTTMAGVALRGIGSRLVPMRGRCRKAGERAA